MDSKNARAIRSKKNAKQIIDLKLAELAKAFGNARIRIEGNTDDRGDAEMNRRLSLKRAQSVANYLISEYQMDKNRFVIVGNGEDKPIGDNNSNEGRSKNRRTECTIIN